MSIEDLNRSIIDLNRSIIDLRREIAAAITDIHLHIAVQEKQRQEAIDAAVRAAKAADDADAWASRE
jgi:hypothetical protein